MYHFSDNVNNFLTNLNEVEEICKLFSIFSIFFFVFDHDYIIIFELRRYKCITFLTMYEPRY